MAKLLLITGFILLSLYSNSQDVKLSRQERKEVRSAQMTANFYNLDTILNSKSFVLEADFLQNDDGERIAVNSSLNFIKVDVLNGILQTGSYSGSGYNGVGGVTAEGKIDSWKINRDLKRLSYSLSFSILTNIGHYDVFMRVTADNHASSTITGLGHGKLTWDGHLEALNNSRVFKGQETF